MSTKNGNADTRPAEDTGTDLVTASGGLARLQRRPIIDTIDEKTLGLIASQIAPNCNRGEIGHFLELCAHYDLDPFAKEAWCAKGRGENAKLLVMVGRDGLRKIAKRNGLEIDGDVVRERDTFKVHRTGKRERLIDHAYDEARAEDTAGAATAEASNRGRIIGAWAEVYERDSGRQVGYFYAPLSEYRPTDARKLQYSPWGSQESVMILAAAERQALRQATPLGGLLAQGEDARVFDADVVDDPPQMPQELTDQEVTDLLKVIDGVGWTEDEARMQLVAAGASDVPDVPTGVRSLRRDQVPALLGALPTVAAAAAADDGEQIADAEPVE